MASDAFHAGSHEAARDNRAEVARGNDAMAERFKHMTRGAGTPKKQALGLDGSLGAAIRAWNTQGQNATPLQHLGLTLALAGEKQLDRALQHLND